MRRTFAAALVAGTFTMVPALGLAAPAGTQAKNATHTRASAAQGAVHATKGIVKSVDAHTLVIARSPRYGREITFVLNPSTERVGSVAVGSTVDIRYRTEARERVATAVTVVPAKQPGSPTHR